MSYKVSVVISMYKAEEFIKGKLDDLLNQTIFENTEIIIINSNSPQKEEEIISSYLSYPNIRYIKTPFTETIYQAWNRGIRTAKGKYITNSNCDDRLRNNALKKLAEYLDNNPDVYFAYSDQYISNIPNETYERVSKRKSSKRPEFSIMALLNGYPAGSNPIWRSELHFKDQLWFDEEYEVAGDYKFLCEVAEKYKVAKISEIWGVYYKSEQFHNKELQNIEKTISESLEIKDEFARRYLSKMTIDDLNKLERRVRRALYMPEILSRIHYKIYHDIFLSEDVKSREFFIWIYSLIKEHKTEMKEAMEVLLKYANKTHFRLIQMQINKLKRVL